MRDLAKVLKYNIPILINYIFDNFVTLCNICSFLCCKSFADLVHLIRIQYIPICYFVQNLFSIKKEREKFMV